MQILDGPLEGEQATLSTVGNYSLDDKDPSRQNVRPTLCKLVCATNSSFA